MASFRDERAVGRLGDLYEEALGALQGGDFERVRELVEAAEPLLPAAPVAEAEDESNLVEHARAVEAHRSLLASLAAERDETLVALMRVRQGRGALAGYRSRVDPRGTRIERDG